MNEEMNAPVSPEPEGVSGWFTTWMQAITKPNEQTFAEIGSSRNAKTSTAFLWVFIGSLVNSFILYLAQGALITSMLSDFSDGSMFGSGAGFSLISAICGAPIAAVISVIVFAIFTGVTQWVAKMFGGTGTFEKLAYTFAAITVPFSLISAILGLLGNTASLPRGPSSAGTRHLETHTHRRRCCSPSDHRKRHPQGARDS